MYPSCMCLAHASRSSEKINSVRESQLCQAQALTVKSARELLHRSMCKYLQWILDSPQRIPRKRSSTPADEERRRSRPERLLLRTSFDLVEFLVRGCIPLTSKFCYSARTAHFGFVEAGLLWCLQALHTYILKSDCGPATFD